MSMLLIWVDRFAFDKNSGESDLEFKRNIPTAREDTYIGHFSTGKKIGGEKEGSGVLTDLKRRSKASSCPPVGCLAA